MVKIEIFQQQPKIESHKFCRKCAKSKNTKAVLYVRFHCAWYQVSTNIKPWSMCKFPFMCCTTITSFLPCHKSLFLLACCNSLHSVPMLQANKVIDVEVYCEQIAMRKLVLITVPDSQQSHLQMVYQSFFKQVIPMRELWLLPFNMSQWCHRVKKITPLHVVKIKLCKNVWNFFIAPLVRKS